jgi:superfamily II DNA/RNA helicase
MGPASRYVVMNKFRKGSGSSAGASHKKKILVMLDSLSRSLANEGLPPVSLVVNYDLPRQPEDYLHR